MNTAWALQTAPTDEPLTVDDAKQQLRLDTDADDAAVERRLKSARSQAETYLMRGLLTQTWTYAQDDWSDEILLPMAAPLASVTSVKYYDTSGVLTTLATTVYLADLLSEPGRVVLKPEQTWPALQANRVLAVEIIYVVGWTAADLITPEIVDAVCLLLGDRQEFRQQTVLTSQQLVSLPNGVEALLAPHRRWWRPPGCA
jgi:uncharacterized phiE125 gp8 family phage protein